MMELKVITEFKRLELPMTADKEKLLEEEIMVNGYKQPFLYWHDYLLMDFTAYELCKKYQVNCTFKSKNYPNMEVAISEICKRHLKLGVCDEYMRKYLIGCRFHAEKTLAKNQPYFSDAQYIYDDSAMKTRERLAKEFKISQHTIYKYGTLAETLNAISEQAPALFFRILNGEIKVSTDTLQAILKMSSLPRKKVLESLLCVKGISVESRRNIVQRQNIGGGERIIGTQTSIKETPKYDPNAEFKSLIYTVPTWNGSLTRVRKVANMVEADLATKQQLRKELITTISIISEFLFEMEESNNG